MRIESATLTDTERELLLAMVRDVRAGIDDASEYQTRVGVTEEESLRYEAALVKAPRPLVLDRRWAASRDAWFVYNSFNEIVHGLWDHEVPDWSRSRRAAAQAVWEKLAALGD